MNLFVVIDIGCLECHEASDLIGIYTDRQQALATEAIPAEELTGYDDWRGQRIRVLFEGETEQQAPVPPSRSGVDPALEAGSEAPRSASERTEPVNPDRKRQGVVV